MKRLTLCLLLFLLSTITVSAQEPTVAAQGAVLLDGNSGRVLWEQGGETPLAMASTTKIMTALLVLEETEPEEIVTVSKTAAHQPEVRMGLAEGEQWRVADLLTAMLLRSYNDAAVALAEHISGSVSAFCEKMTERAVALGATDTVFGSPNGLDSHLSPQQHHSTARDMAKITAYALQNPEFRRIVALPEASITNVEGKHLCHFTNADRLLREYPDAIGVKTGYTNRAGHCFVGAAERGEVLLITTVLGSGWGSSGKEQKWKDTKALLDYGFSTYQIYPLFSADEKAGVVSVQGSSVSALPVSFAEDYSGLFSAEERDALQIEILLPEVVSAPVERGDKLGSVRLSLKGETLTEIDLVAAADAPSYTLKEQLLQLAKQWLGWRNF